MSGAVRSVFLSQCERETRMPTPITIPIPVSITQHFSKELEMCVLPNHSPLSFCKGSRESFTLWIFFSIIVDLALIENSSADHKEEGKPNPVSENMKLVAGSLLDTFAQ